MHSSVRVSTGVPPIDRVGLSDSFDRLLTAALREDALSGMVYGSRARGSARPDSDVDLLLLVPGRPGSYTSGLVNVTCYTPEHLARLAAAGSLFVAHLVDEGVTVFDHAFALRNALGQYRPRTDHSALRRELGLILRAAGAEDAEQYQVGLVRATVWALRTEIYTRCAESGRLTFDLAVACSRSGVPGAAALLREAVPEDLPDLRQLGDLLLPQGDGEALPGDVAGLAVWAWRRRPLAARVLESVLAGASTLEYSALTIPAL